MNRVMTRYRWVLAAWALASIMFFAQARIRFGSRGGDLPFEGLLDLLHPYYLGLLLTTVCIIPAALFAPSLARAYGGGQSAVGRAVMFLTLAAVSFGIGDAIWFWYTTCTSWGMLGCDAAVEVPYPSWADVGYLLMLPLAAIALHSLTKVVNLRPRDYGIVAAIAFLIAIPTVWMTWSIGGHGKQWLYDSSSPGFLDALGQLLMLNLELGEASNLISGIYVLSDVVLFSFAVVLLVFARRTTGGVFIVPLVAVALAFMFQYVADMLFFKRVFDETLSSADITDIFDGLASWTIMLSIYLFGRAFAQMTRELPASDQAAAVTMR